MSGKEFHKRGELIAVCSGKGGVGRTLVSVNLAIAVSKKQQEVSIFDADFQFGDINMALDLQTNLSINDLVPIVDQLDQKNLHEYLLVHSSGVRVLSAPDRPESADLITLDVVEKTLDLLLMENDYVVVDTEVGFQEKSLSIIEKADQILLVTNLEISTLKNTKLMLETFKTLDLLKKVRIVVNRSTMKTIVKLDDLTEILGTDTFYYLPCNETVATKSLNEGKPFVISNERTDLAKACYKLADQLMDKYDSNRRKKSSSFLPKLFIKDKHVKEAGKK